MPSSGSTLGHQLNFCFTQRCLSLHWTVKCSNLFLLGPDASWMAVKIAAGLWYMGFPVLTLGSPFLLHIITKASTLSQREMENALSQWGWGECGLQEVLCVSEIEICREWAAALNLVLVRCGCVVFGLIPFIIVHVFLWDCGVSVSLSFCYAGLILEQGASGTMAAEAKINSFASNNILPVTSAFIK